jgi:hypothetical protein
MLIWARHGAFIRTVQRFLRFKKTTKIDVCLINHQIFYPLRWNVSTIYPPVSPCLGAMWTDRCLTDDKARLLYTVVHTPLIILRVVAARTDVQTICLTLLAGQFFPQSLDILTLSSTIVLPRLIFGGSGMSCGS